MSAPFSPENRHHLLLAEAHQVNEFLDSRLIGAEVPDGERVGIARAVLTLALASRRERSAFRCPWIGACEPTFAAAPGDSEAIRLVTEGAIREGASFQQAARQVSPPEPHLTEDRQGPGQ